MRESVLVVHNVRSAHNVGSMFRTADAMGVSKIYLTGYTPSWVDPRGKVRKEFVKVSLGAEQFVPSARYATLAAALKQLKKEGFEIVALEQDKRATALSQYKPRGQKIALVVGNEVRGISKASQKRCDAVVEIAMHGKKESLNVSVACGVALYALLNRS